MKTYTLVFTGVLLGLAATLLRADPQPPPANRIAELIRAKADAAHKTYDFVWQNNREGYIVASELVYRWSRRWLEAELELSSKKVDQVAAYKAHLHRMQALERITHDRFRNRVITIDEVSATDYYTAEARLWDEQALAKQ